MKYDRRRKNTHFSQRGGNDEAKIVAEHILGRGWEGNPPLKRMRPPKS